MNIHQLVRPKHTLVSVLEELARGLADGTIDLGPPESELFPNWAAELRIAVTSLSPEFLEAYPDLKRLGGGGRRFDGMAVDLESLIQSVQRLRRMPDSVLAQDLPWHVEVISRKLHAVMMATGIGSEVARKHIGDADNVARMVRVASRQAPFLLEELTYQLELSLTRVLETIVDRAGRTISEEFGDFLSKMWRPYQHPGGVPREKTIELERVVHHLQIILSGDLTKRIKEVQATIATLNIAYERATARTVAAVGRAGMIDTRGPSEHKGDPSPKELNDWGV